MFLYKSGYGLVVCAVLHNVYPYLVTFAFYFRLFRTSAVHLMLIICYLPLLLLLISLSISISFPYNFFLSILECFLMNLSWYHHTSHLKSQVLRALYDADHIWFRPCSSTTTKRVGRICNQAVLDLCIVKTSYAL